MLSFCEMRKRFFCSSALRSSSTGYLEKLIVIGMGILMLPLWSVKAGRTVVNMDGVWQIGQSTTSTPPVEFSQTCPVPGLVDMASPAFTETGKKNDRREYFWYRKMLSAPAELPEYAFLKIHKAMFGVAVWLNGHPLGEQTASFTPTYWDLLPHLKPGVENEILVRIGANHEILPKGTPAAWDFEKKTYTPGIYDSVEAVFSGGPRIVNVQTVPDINAKRVRLLIELESPAKKDPLQVDAEIAEAKSGTVVAKGTAASANVGGNQILDITLPVPNAHLWTPEDPFLYQVNLKTAGDSLNTRFGMREFRFDPVTKRAVLNGQERYLTGTNVTIYRFFEDKERANFPWDREWVGKLHRKFKEMNWSTVRYCIGFPPDFWYDIADEEGFLIEDEFPIWTIGEDAKREQLRAGDIMPQYRDWMRERWNHPCVVIWDAQNESFITASNLALMGVRHLDYSNRPWENGFGAPQGPYDCVETHPYLFIRGSGVDTKKKVEPFHLSELGNTSPKPALLKTQEAFDVPIIINEYDWMWLNRDGTPTLLSKHNYLAALGKDATPEQCREYHARVVAALTEFWRCNRQVAGLLHFCGLGYSRPDGQTSDDFLSISRLEFEPAFFKYVGDAFNPVGLMLDFWKERVPANSVNIIKVSVINDRKEPWNGEVRLKLKDGAVLARAKCNVETNGRIIVPLRFQAPAQPGKVILVGELDDGGKTIRSLRDVEITADK